MIHVCTSCTRSGFHVQFSTWGSLCSKEDSPNINTFLRCVWSLLGEGEFVRKDFSNRSHFSTGCGHFGEEAELFRGRGGARPAHPPSPHTGSPTDCSGTSYM